MAKGWMDLLLDKIFDEKWVGRHGEKLTERELNLVRLFGRKGKVLRNVYIPKDNGETSEIDVLFITQKGIFVIESKNYSGWIFGDEKSFYWTAMLANKEKNKFYNPIKQNNGHLKWLGKYLGDCVPLFSMIVFSERCELKKISVESSNTYVIKRDMIYATVRKIWNSSIDKLDDAQIDTIYAKLKDLTKVDNAIKEAHITNIEEKYKKSKDIGLQEKEHNMSENINLQSEEFVCPRCGQKLVLRTAKKGSNIGNKFYGCSSFPKCKYTKEFE